MPVNLQTSIGEKGTLIIQCTFKDEGGTSLIPNTFKWSLVDRRENVINNRDQVQIVPSSSTVNIVLSDLDLVISNQDNVSESRFVIVEATYDSQYGNDLPINGSAEFNILNIKKIT